MKSPTSPRCFLTRAIHLALLTAGSLITFSSQAAPANPSAVSQVTRNLIVFGDPAAIAHAGDLIGGNRNAAVLSGAELDASAIERLSGPDAGAIAVVAAAQLAHLGDAGAVLTQMFEAGVPVFVCTDGEHSAEVARMFGLAPPQGDAIYLRDPSGSVSVLGNARGEAHWDPVWSRRTAASLSRFRADASAMAATPTPTPTSTRRTRALTAEGPVPVAKVLQRAPETATGLPMLVFHEGVIDTGTDEISGRATIKVIRSATRTEDDKQIEVHSWPTITPKGAGIYEGHKLKPAKNLTAAYLPWVYRVSHKVSAAGTEARLVESLPESDGRTDFEREWKKTRVINIGGNVGDGASSDGKPDAGLAAKIPFNLSFSYSNTTEETIRSSFKDYSLLARPVDGGRRMIWEAPIDPSLRHNLVEKVHADKATLSEKRMTPMMRSATLESWSVWEVPGDYEGMATVEIEAGYDRNEKTWWWDRTNFRHKENTLPVSATKRYVIDLSHPFLTREITVLIRSALGNGSCLSARGNEVDLATCDAAQRTQMWGLDSEQRYVNRATGHCLEADMASQRLRMASCTLANNQVWQWRADRVHSGFNDGHHRLYVNHGKPRFHVDNDLFDNTPANPHNAILRPWSGYPKAPIAGELIPAPFGVIPGVVPTEWVRSFQSVGPEQRWNLIVLREGLAPAK